MARCDLCGCRAPAGSLKQLLSSYQLPEVVDLCGDCSNFADEAKLAETSKIADRVQSALLERYNFYHTDQAKPPSKRFKFLTALKRFFQ